ncbi:MAG: AIR synthase-related protein, partial [Terriglobia bacterium]
LERNRSAAHQPRLALGAFLRSDFKATAAIDLSDGLSLDLRRLCLASNTAAELDADPPRSSGASLDQALHGGEDYELLFTVRPGVKVPAQFAGVPLTRIGRIVKGKPGHVSYRGATLPALGYDHFSLSKHPKNPKPIPNP